MARSGAARRMGRFAVRFVSKGEHINGSGSGAVPGSSLMAFADDCLFAIVCNVLMDDLGVTPPFTAEMCCSRPLEKVPSKAGKLPYS